MDGGFINRVGPGSGPGGLIWTSLMTHPPPPPAYSPPHSYAEIESIRGRYIETSMSLDNHSSTNSYAYPDSVTYYVNQRMRGSRNQNNTQSETDDTQHQEEHQYEHLRR